MAVRASARTVPGQPSNDHGWERQGRRSLRKFPTLALAGPDDANKRGVWVPTTSVEQYGASLATWFGLTPDQLTQVFPNLPNFKTRRLLSFTSALTSIAALANFCCNRGTRSESGQTS